MNINCSLGWSHGSIDLDPLTFLLEEFFLRVKASHILKNSSDKVHLFWVMSSSEHYKGWTVADTSWVPWHIPSVDLISVQLWWTVPCMLPASYLKPAKWYLSAFLTQGFLWSQRRLFSPHMCSVEVQKNEYLWGSLWNNGDTSQRWVSQLLSFKRITLRLILHG